MADHADLVGELSTTAADLKPGSDAALAAGCTCPVLDNARGRGYMGVPGIYVYSAGCSVHCPPGGGDA